MGAKTSALAITGAIVGTVIAPGVGTVLGAKIGAGLGATADGVEIASNVFGKKPKLVSNCYHSYRYLRVERIRVRSIWLAHGSFSAVGSAITGIATSNSLTHWWVEIETNDPSIWFCAQFNAPNLELYEYPSQYKVTESGCECVGRNTNCDITDKYIHSPGNRTIGEVEDFIEEYCEYGPYNVVSNNCQHFGERLHYWI